MKLLTTMLGVFLLFLTHSAQAQAMFAGFDDFCKLPVVVGDDPQTASARTDQYGRKYIHMDRGAMADWTAPRIFVLAHECAHHRLGHTSALGHLERYTGGTAKQELEADCWAARVLAQAGYHGDIKRMMLQTAYMGHFASPGYPTGTQRSVNIGKCAASGGSLSSASSCREELISEQYVDYQTVIQPVPGPCQHCSYTFSGYICMHPYDVSPAPVTIPVTKTRMVSKTVCD